MTAETETTTLSASEESLLARSRERLGAAVPATAVTFDAPSPWTDTTAVLATVPATAMTAVLATAVPATPEPPQPSQNIVRALVYVCKKHANGTAYFIAEGTAFCNLCLRDFFKRHLLRQMKKNTTP